MKVTIRNIEGLHVSVKTETGALVFFRNNNETQPYVEPFDHGEKRLTWIEPLNRNKKKIVEANKEGLFPNFLFYRGAGITTYDRGISFFECNKEKRK